MFVLTLAALAAAPPTVPATAAAACITMNTEKLPLNRRTSPLDSLSFTVGSSDVKVCYSRPSLRGRTMFGSDLVPFGKIWRTGANEPTMIHTSGAITIAGVAVPAGTYSLYTVPGEKEWEVVVNRAIKQWGHESTYTDEVKAQEVGRGKVKAETLSAPVEKLTMTQGLTDGKTTALVLEWDKSRVAIPVK
jgi:hypothetical protein